jgi:hypothetical protein
VNLRLTEEEALAIASAFVEKSGHKTVHVSRGDQKLTREDLHLPSRIQGPLWRFIFTRWTEPGVVESNTLIPVFVDEATGTAFSVGPFDRDEDQSFDDDESTDLLGQIQRAVLSFEMFGDVAKAIAIIDDVVSESDSRGNLAIKIRALTIAAQLHYGATDYGKARDYLDRIAAIEFPGDHSESIQKDILVALELRKKLPQ